MFSIVQVTTKASPGANLVLSGGSFANQLAASLPELVGCPVFTGVDGVRRGVFVETSVGVLVAGANVGVSVGVG